MYIFWPTHYILHTFKQNLLHVFDSVYFLANTLHFTFLQTKNVTCICQCTLSGLCISFYIPSNNVCDMYLTVYIFWPTHYILHSFKKNLLHLYLTVYIFWPTHYTLHSFKRYLLHMYFTVYIFWPTHYI